jgi:glutamyl-tRNA synthetase
MILGPSGDRLSKRDGAVSVIEYKKDGFLAEALLNYLARLGWSHGDQEIFSRSELVNFFSLDAIGKKGAVFDIQKLLWVNGMHMRQLSNDQLLGDIESNVMPGISARLAKWDHDRILHAIGLYKDRVETLKALGHELIALHDGPSMYNQDDLATWITPQALHLLSEIKHIFLDMQLFDHDELQKELKHIAKRHDVKLVACAQPLRIALIGSSNGPGVFALLQLLQKEESMRRIDMLLKESR